MERRYELIDTTDNDCHDEGPRELMQEYADERNRMDVGHDVKQNRWRVKPEGYAAANFKG